jgi:repressor of nif and glnA expression
MNGKFRRRRLAILEILKQHEGPVISHDIAYALNQRGLDVSERTIRLDLQEMDRQGVTLSHGRRGHRLSEAGLAELHLARTHERVGFLSSKIDAMTYAMTFDLDRCAGEVVVNTTLCASDQLRGALGEIAAVFAKGYGARRADRRDRRPRPHDRILHRLLDHPQRHPAEARHPRAVQVRRAAGTA